MGPKADVDVNTAGHAGSYAGNDAASYAASYAGNDAGNDAGRIRRARAGPELGDRVYGGRPTGQKLDLRNTWQVVAGSVLIPLGVAFILLAWYGAAHTRFVQQQIPYLVSGSFAGVGCMVLGGLLYWAHWLYRLYDQADDHHEELMQALMEVVSASPSRVDPTGSSASQPGSQAGATRDRGRPD